MLTFINNSLPQKFLNILKILFINDFCQHSQSVGLKHIIICLLNIFCKTTNNHEDIIFINFKLLNENIDESSQVRIKFIPLALRNLEKFCHVEEKLLFFDFSEDLTLVEKENNFV
jgi:hypothetical protein